MAFFQWSFEFEMGLLELLCSFAFGPWGGAVCSSSVEERVFLQRFGGGAALLL